MANVKNNQETVQEPKVDNTPVNAANGAETANMETISSNEFSYSIDSNMLMKAMQRFRIRMIKDKSKSFYNAWKVTKVKVEMITDGPIPWPRMSISLAAPIKARVFNKETQEYETGESSVIYVSAWQVLNVLQNDPFFAAYVDKMRDDFSLLELAMSMADIWIAQEYIIAGEQSRDVITDRERKKVYDHDIIINTLLKIETSDLAKRRVTLQTMSNVKIDVAALLGI